MVLVGFAGLGVNCVARCSSLTVGKATCFSLRLLGLGGGVAWRSGRREEMLLSVTVLVVDLGVEICVPAASLCGSLE